MKSKLTSVGIAGFIFGLTVGALLCLVATFFNPWFNYDIRTYLLAGLVIPGLWSGAVSLIVGLFLMARPGGRGHEALTDPVRLGICVSIGVWTLTIGLEGLWIITSIFKLSLLIGMAAGALTAWIAWKVSGKRILSAANSHRVAILRVGAVFLVILVILPVAIGVTVERNYRKHRVSKKPFTLIYMLDGAEWAVIDPLIEQGRMPTIGRLKNEEAWGKLATGPVNGAPSNFTSLLTGYMPDKSGLSGFYENRWWQKKKTLLDFANDEGYRVGVYRWMIFWPPVHYQGYCVPSWTGWDNETWPENLTFLTNMETGMVPGLLLTPEKELLYLLESVPYGATINSFAAYFKYILSMPREDYAKYRQKAFFHGVLDADMQVGLYRRFKTDIAAFSWYEFDPISHVMWIYHEPEKYPGRYIDPVIFKNYHNIIRDIYSAADKNLGNVISRLPADTTIAIVSDHGFGADSRPTHMIYPVREEALIHFVGLDGKVDYQTMGEEFIVRPREGATFPPGVNPLEYIAQPFRDIQVQELGRQFFDVKFVPLGVRVTRYGPNKLNDLFNAHLVLGSKVAPLTDLIIPFYGTGRHYKFGIILLSGPNIQPKTFLGEKRMVDLAPTISALLGLPIPEDTDGTVMPEVFKPGWLDQHPPRSVSVEMSLLHETPQPGRWGSIDLSASGDATSEDNLNQH